jgi:predicted lipase
MSAPWLTITEVEHVTDELLQHALDITEDFFIDQPMDRFDFIDRVEDRAEVDFGPTIDTRAIEHLLQAATKHKKELNA